MRQSADVTLEYRDGQIGGPLGCVNASLRRDAGSLNLGPAFFYHVYVAETAAFRFSILLYHMTVCCR